MGKWLFNLDIKELHNQAKEHSILPNDWAKNLANEIKNQLHVLYNNDEELEQIVFDLEYDIDDNSTWNDTDSILEDLYNWADYVRCWIRTF